MKIAENIQTKDINEFKKILKAQCPAICKRNGFMDDEDMMKIMAVGYKYNRDYLLDFVDHCVYWRMKESEKKSGNLIFDSGINSWIRMMLGIFPDTMDAIKLIMDAVVGFNGPRSTALSTDGGRSGYENFRSFITFEFQHERHLIDDSIEMTVRYLCSVCELIESIRSDAAPFQIDLCIKYGSAVTVERQLDLGILAMPSLSDDSDETEDEDEESSSDTPFIQRHQSRDPIQDIGKKLKEFNMKYIFNQFKYQGSKVSSNLIINGYIRIHCHIEHTVPMDIINLLSIYFGENYLNYELTSCLFTAFNTFREKYNFNPNYKRFIIFADKRKTDNDDIWIYEPYDDDDSKNCKDIPKDALSYWYINSSATSILPNQYTHITCCKNNNYYSMLTFSFQIQSKDYIKCYMYYNHKLVTFFSNDFMGIFKWIFNYDWKNDNSSNESFVKNKVLIEQFVNILDQTIRY